MRLCRREHVPVVPRGSGTGLIGGAMAPVGGVMVVDDPDEPHPRARLRQPLRHRRSPGLINLWLTQATREHGYYFAPDPSSQMVSSIGGNASTNAGGPHCLKYGITVNHVLGLQVVTGRGRARAARRQGARPPGLRPHGRRWSAREGTLGLVTAIIVRLLHVPEAVKTLLASFSAHRRRLRGGLGDHRGGHHPRGARDASTRSSSAPSTRASAPAIPRARARCC